MFEENAVGYLMKALDADTEQQVGQYLRSHPEAQARLELLRKALTLLEADREEPEPPRGLCVRTLARVAEYRCAAPLRLPQAPVIRSYAARRAWWSRADVLVAASILLLVIPFVPPAINYMQQEQKRALCLDNMRGFHQAFVLYGDQHNGDFPKLEERPPRNFAGMFVPVLRDAGVLGDVSVSCPAAGGQAPSDLLPGEIDKMYYADRERYDEIARTLAGCYGYSLGYRDEYGRLHGIGRSTDDHMPVLGDKPPFEQAAADGRFAGNSRNHRGRGQSILYKGGDARFVTSRNAGPNGDDIYVNREGRPEAGLDPFDAVLGASAFRPKIEENPDK
jgi:hypothetical protein